MSAFVIGSLYTRVTYLERGTSTVAKAAENGNVAGDSAGEAGQGELATADNLPEVTKDDHVKGNLDARILLVEYSDLECPFCQRFHPTAQQAVDEYGGQVAWVFRHFPLSFHANAQKMAEASECAAELDGEEGFWNFVDIVFERGAMNGTSFTDDQVVGLATEIGLNKNKFTECYDSGRYSQLVQDQMVGGQNTGVTGTPGNILLDTKTGETRLIPGAVPYEQLKLVIDELLQN